MPSYRAAMWYLAILVAFGVCTVNGQFNCPPDLVGANFFGVRTKTTATVQYFYCCIAQSPGILSSDEIATLVGYCSVLNNIDLRTLNRNNLPPYYNATANGIYTAQLGTVSQLCTQNVDLREGFRIGNNAACINNPNLPFCNGPIPLRSDPLCILGLIFRDNVLLGTTTLSQPISLRKPTPYTSIDTSISSRSATMIVITVILPILFALLLLIFTILLFLKCCCRRAFTPSKCEQE